MRRYGNGLRQAQAKDRMLGKGPSLTERARLNSRGAEAD